jgi:hypothetical protein
MHTSIFDLTVLAAAALPTGSSTTPVVFLYFGPEVVLPIASFVAGALGVILMFWRQIRSFIVRGFRAITGRGAAEPAQLPDDLDTDLAITTASGGDVSPKGKGE